MKTIKTHAGIKKIDDLDNTVFLFQLRELLTDYRASLISRLINDLTTYIDYKFHVKPDGKQLPEIKVKLYSLKISNVDLEKYNGVVKHIMAHESTYLTTEPFYQEIDENISWYFRERQLTLVA
jgi:kynurenine formamidase